MSVLIARDSVQEPLHLVVPISNPWRWKSRWKHLERSLKHFIDSGAVVTLVECAFNRRQLVYEDSGLDGTPANCRYHQKEYKHRYIGLASASELWLKECMINRGVQDITERDYKWNQVCWVDGDVHFQRPGWCSEAIHKLQHGGTGDIAFLQMFSQALDLGPNYEVLPASYPHAQGVSFAHAFREGYLKPTLSTSILKDLESMGGDLNQLMKDFMVLEEDLEGNYYGQDGSKKTWPGLAWGCTRNAWNAVGGLMDFAVWGGSDWASSHALIGKKEQMIRTDVHSNYKMMTDEWFDRCERSVRRNVLVMEGAITHYWHGRKMSRGYNEKHRILAKYQFDPLRDLKRDGQGLYLHHDDGSERFIQLRDAFRRVALSRNEDANETGIDFGQQGH